MVRVVLLLSVLTICTDRRCSSAAPLLIDKTTERTLTYFFARAFWRNFWHCTACFRCPFAYVNALVDTFGIAHFVLKEALSSRPQFCQTETRLHLAVRWRTDSVKPNFHLAHHVMSRHDTARSTCRAHAFWLCRACRKSYKSLSIRSDFFVKLKKWPSTIILSVSVKYSVRYLLSDINNYD